MNDLKKVVPWEVDCIDDSKGAPWTELVDEDYHVKVFRDMYPVTEGHLLFVPEFNTPDVLIDAFESALRYGERIRAPRDSHRRRRSGQSIRATSASF